MMQDQKPIDTSFMQYLRGASRIKCQFCAEECPSDPKMRDHLRSQHPTETKNQNIDDLIRNMKGGRRSPPRHHSNSAGNPKGSRARSSLNPQLPDPDFDRGMQPSGKLFNPAAGPSSTIPLRKNPMQPRAARPPASCTGSDAPQDDEEEDSDVNRLIKEPDTRPISQEQLVAEVKGIYAGLMMIESKCIEVDNAQSAQCDANLNNEQWQALIALHRTLLYEHHDFFLASQHPSASPALKRLASKYAMPARMWRHAIHSFLELLRHRLPASFEYMLTFVYMAYSMLSLLYETVPVFEDTWIECLGDLGRYRMAIEDDDIRDREVWTSVSRNWYSKASDKAPTTGRLYHHLAILARPNALQQLFYYSKSLCVSIPFASTKESIMTLFEPIFSVNGYQHSRLLPVDVAFVKAHGVLFSRKHISSFRPAVSEFFELLDGHIGQAEKRWLQAGYHMAIANSCALLSYGNENNVLMRLIQTYQAQNKESEGMEVELDDLKPTGDFEDAIHLAMGTNAIIFNRQDDANVLPYTHVAMAFMYHLARTPQASDYVERHFPWAALCSMINCLLESHHSQNRNEKRARMMSEQFPGAREKTKLESESNGGSSEDEPSRRPLPEDFALKGLVFVDQYYPADWFASSKTIDDDEKYFEMASMADVRKERILWLCYRIAQSGRGLTYDNATDRFGVLPLPPL
ncbi:hypothetical protein GGR50DRAFT_691861 [Xylaria sp. CBS 124048]|nr:hypothetical protein GGR50DRAFT_691861 [Xylaria sp. CBS 124048]